MTDATRFIDVENPFTREIWARVPRASAADVDAAVAAARNAFGRGPWGAGSPAYRAQILRGLADIVAGHVDELTELQVRENGKAIREQHAQTSGVPGYLRYYAGVAEDIVGKTIPSSATTSFCYTVRQPLGVVAAITPWNSPLSLLLWKLAPALAAGNTIVVKPSEISPVSTIRLAELALEAGLPAGVFNVVTGLADVGAQLAGHPDVDKVAFTGSTAAGREVGMAAVGHLARVSLELGGKSANVIFADANLDLALDGIVGGVFAAAGQTCIAGSRVLVHKDIYDEFAGRLVERANRVKLGDPMDWSTEVGAIACRAQFEKVARYVDIALNEGAALLAGGRAPADPSLGQGLFFEPTIFGDVEAGMRIAREEVFGPVLCLSRFGTEEEAVQMANDTRFGLAAGLWTSDLSRAHRMIRRLRGGTVWVNTYRRLNYTLPFGGFGDSGFGRENGRDAVDDYTEVKSVWIETDESRSDPFNPMR
jgi:(Z)-2-((N-methylformamido)methylene)-5-hydroxybutyrolactone dehydrogenase